MPSPSSVRNCTLRQKTSIEGNQADLALTLVYSLHQTHTRHSQTGKTPRAPTRAGRVFFRLPFQLDQERSRDQEKPSGIFWLNSIPDNGTCLGAEYHVMLRNGAGSFATGSRRHHWIVPVVFRRSLHRLFPTNSRRSVRTLRRARNSCF